jgi:hypothetical protein
LNSAILSVPTFSQKDRPRQQRHFLNLFWFSNKILLGDQIKGDERGGTSSRNGELKNVYKTLVGKSDKDKPFWRTGLRRGLILTCILNKKGGKVWIGFRWLTMGTSGELL